MNIAIDVLAILGPDSKNRGIGNYNTSQFKKLFEMDKKNRYFLLNFYENSSLFEILEYSDNVTEHFFYTGKDGFLNRETSFKEIIGDIVKKFIETNNIDVFYITSPFDRNMSYDSQWLENVKTIATVYDIIPYLFRKRYLNQKKHFDIYIDWVNKLKRLDKLLAISQSVKDDLVNHFQIDPSKIEVIYAGVEDVYKRLELSDSEIKKIKTTYNIQDQYIMCTGGDDDRKNIAELIIAYSKLPKHLVDKYQLVIACKLSNASEERYNELASSHNVGDRVILTNFIPLDHLIKLYNLAHVMAFPSQYEGFGLPVVEAMACGTPVLTSNNSSLGEIANGAAVVVDPFKTNDIARGLVEILEKVDLNDLVQKGYERIKKFTWNKVAQCTYDCLMSFEFVNSPEIDKVKKKIAFFTPLPPLQSGIADYSVDILNKLAEFYTIDVYIDKNYSIDCKLAENISVYYHDKFNLNKNGYVDVIFQMGNSEFHAYMIDYLQKYSGTLVLHDYNLHGLLYHITMNKSDENKYKKFLYEDFDKELVDNYVNDVCSGKSPHQIYELPCNGVVTNYAKKIIVHSDYVKKLLLNKDIKRNVKKIQHYATINNSSDLNEIRKKLSIGEDKIVLSAFGHIHETKRILPILKAFSKLLTGYKEIMLYLVGKPAPNIKGTIEDFIKNNNLLNKVVITGYTDISLFEQYIDATDICLNLRYPYNGETSGSLMRILSKGKCVVLNDLGSFSEIPDNCCLKLKSPEALTEDEEVEMITEKLEEILTNQELISMIGNKAKQFAEENLDIVKIAKHYADFIERSQIPSSITEAMKRDIVEYMIQNKLDNTDEIYGISKTLAYVKSQ